LIEKCGLADGWDAVPNSAEMRVRRFFEVRPLSLDLGDMLVQVVAVALGVVIGFGVTSLNERMHQRALLRETVGNIVTELRSNQAGMHVVEKEHAKSAAILAAVVARAHSSVTLEDGRRALRESGQFRVNIPLAIGWQIAQNDQGLTLLPYKDRYDLAWIYQVQLVYYNAEQRYQNSLLTLTESPNGNYYFQSVDLANQARAVVAAEHQLDILYAEAIDQSKKQFGL
jgi:hypothetical protein